MNTNRIPSRVLFVSASIAVAACAAFTIVAANTHTSAASAAAPRAALSDAPIAAFRTELLDVAFRSASALPLQPHARNRARAQEAVAAACLSLDQPARARACVDEIGDWRRGAGYADLAGWCAEHGRADLAPELIELARGVADARAKAAGDGNVTDTWQPERIRAKIARAQHALGEHGAARAEAAPEPAFDEQLATLRTTVTTGSFDEVRAALDALVQLWTRFRADAEKRARIEEQMDGVWNKLPKLAGIEVRFELARGCLAEEDRGAARHWIDAASELANGPGWPAEVQVGLRARVGALLHDAGDAEAAHGELAAALALYDVQRDLIVDIERAEALRSVAEAWHTLGDDAAALRTYRRALDEGVANPNSRPRAEDLSATCRSMACAGVEPDAETWARIRAIASGLGAPW